MRISRAHVFSLILFFIVSGPVARGIEASSSIPQEPRTILRVVDVKHAEVGLLANAIRQIGFRGSVVPDAASRTLTLRGNGEEVNAMGAMIEKLDVAPPPVRNLELTAYLLVALDKPQTDPPLPAKLETVVKQLRATFNYQGYQLLETLVVRNREGKEGSVTGVVPSSPETPLKTFYTFSYRSADVARDEKGNVIRIDRLILGARIPIPVESGAQDDKVQYQNTGVQTNVDMREGQMVVIGKANVDGSNNALIIVLTAKVVE
ncbi:MAG: hypothetical protein HY650_14695 [Acidobacteria bacterium]|nr:hypothetical protein [Acidobacteriota bacterium]